MRPRTRRTEPHRHKYTGILLVGSTSPDANPIEFVVKANDENEKPIGEPVYRCSFGLTAPEALMDLRKVHGKIGHELFAIHEWREAGPWVRQGNGDHHVLLDETLPRRRGEI